jgi:hypothetical protein
MREIEKLKEEILQDYPRLTEDSIFSFNCHHGVSCFNNCCGDVNIFLTPYDIIRLKNKLGISSTEFLEKHTLAPFDKNLRFPVVLLKMQDDEGRTCPFVASEGCTVYDDRPWACRMYPLGMASPGEDNEELNEQFYFLLKESICKGFDEDRELTVADWIKDQGIELYNEMGEGYKEITTDKRLLSAQNLTPQKMEMMHMVFYDIDRFREFLFGSSFFNKFDVDDAAKAELENDDAELLKFGYKWLRFVLFGEQSIPVKAAILSAKQKEVQQQLKRQKSA